MPPAPIPRDEGDRLAALHAIDLLGAPPNPRFDVLTRLASSVLGRPIAAVSLVDAGTQVFKSITGLSVAETPREISFCAHAIVGTDPVMVVEDARADPRFADNSLVTGEPHIRFYAGAVLRDRLGYALGTLCVIGREPGTLTETDRKTLADLAAGVEAAIELHEAFRSLGDLATKDHLTGLPNRSLFHARVRGAVAAPAPCALFSVDLDHFKQVNDTLGHAAGDSVLQEAARRLATVAGPAGMASRVGGDEFAVLMPGVGARREALAFGRELIGAFAAPWSVGGCELMVEASVGIAIAAHGTSATDLLRQADVALYQAKGRGGGRIELFEPEGGRPRAGRPSIGGGYRTKVDSFSRDPNWHPIVSVRDRRIAAFEAVGPSCRLCPELDRPRHVAGRDGDGPAFVRHGAAMVRDLLDYAAGLPAETRVSLNVSARWSCSTGLYRLLADAFDRTGVDPRRLQIEIPEPAMTGDVWQLSCEVSSLRALGAAVALDDFSGGLATLEQIDRFAFDSVKLHAKYLTGLHRNRRARTIASATIRLCRELGLTIVAQGVQTWEQFEYLREAGCDMAQGPLDGLALGPAASYLPRGEIALAGERRLG